MNWEKSGHRKIMLQAETTIGNRRAAENKRLTITKPIIIMAADIVAELNTNPSYGLTVVPPAVYHNSTVEQKRKTRTDNAIEREYARTKKARSGAIDGNETKRDDWDKRVHNRRSDCYDENIPLSHGNRIYLSKADIRKDFGKSKHDPRFNDYIERDTLKLISGESAFNRKTNHVNIPVTPKQLDLFLTQHTWTRFTIVDAAIAEHGEEALFEMSKSIKPNIKSKTVHRYTCYKPSGTSGRPPAWFVSMCARVTPTVLNSL